MGRAPSRRWRATGTLGSRSTRPESRARPTMTGPGAAGAPAATRPCRVSRQRRCSETGALRWESQIARATRGRDLHLNVPFPRKPPDLLMAESPPTGGLSALAAPQPPLFVARRLANPRTPVRLARYASEATRTLPIDARGAVRDASLEDGPRLAEHQSVEPVHQGLDERESGAGSGQDVVQRRREPLARLLELALDV
jgi:hypothetical protein